MKIKKNLTKLKKKKKKKKIMQQVQNIEEKNYI